MFKLDKMILDFDAMKIDSTHLQEAKIDLGKRVVEEEAAKKESDARLKAVADKLAAGDDVKECGKGGGAAEAE